MATKTNLCKQAWLEDKLSSPNLDEQTLANELLGVKECLVVFQSEILDYRCETDEGKHINQSKAYQDLMEFIGDYDYNSETIELGKVKQCLVAFRKLMDKSKDLDLITLKDLQKADTYKKLMENINGYEG